MKYSIMNTFNTLHESRAPVEHYRTLEVCRLEYLKTSRIRHSVFKHEHVSYFTRASCRETFLYFVHVLIYHRIKYSCSSAIALISLCVSKFFSVVRPQNRSVFEALSLCLS